MPTYEYICENCGKKFEKDVPMSERDKVKCVECGSEKVKRVYGSINIVGTGKGSTCTTCTSQTCSQCPLKKS